MRKAQQTIVDEAPAVTRKRERKRYEFLLRAEQPIAHASETIGNDALLMRQRVRTPGGWADVPIITGDTMRHGMREAAAWALLDAAGMIENASLSEGALRLLFAGGMVTGKGDAGVINLDRYRELCELVPSMALFGGCADNRIVPGRLCVEAALIVSVETESYIPKWIMDKAYEFGPLESCRSHVEEAQRVRMDPALVPEKRLLLTGAEQVALNKRLTASEAAHTDDDARAKDEAKSSMMPRRFERIAQGSLFAWSCEAVCWTDLEIDTLNVAVCAFLSNAVVGGKRGTGHGRIRALAAQGVQVERPADAMYPIDALAPASKVGELFRAHVRERSGRIKDFFVEVNA